ncbi:MAG: 30S ribosomal protein S6 [Acidobacteria bacterium]|nr:MAG: 30S ribosomal protein S6 [Acidobacteriota bacterium]
MRNYEIMFIVNPNAVEDEIDKINAQLEAVITSGGGQIQKIEKMGKRRLAYEVDRLREGYYVLFATAANGDIVKECERRLRVMDAVIKYITVRVDDDVRRLEKIRKYRQKRAARRGSGAAASASGQSIEEAMQ